MKTSALQALYVLMALFFLIVCITFTFANYHVDRVINDIFVSIANGASINEFNKIIVGLISKAKFRIIDTQFASVIALSSLLLSYLSLQAYLFSKRGIPFRRFFQMRYWTIFMPTFSYRLYSRKKDEQK